jgi:hypothetical protein
MAIHIFISLLNAKDGRDDEFNEWYSQKHIPELLKIHGFITARRFLANDAQLAGMTPPWKYMVIYEIEADSPASSLQELGRRISGDMVISDALAGDVAAWTYSPTETYTRGT